MGYPSSAPYRPTDEHLRTSPLLTACGHAGMTEREVIEHLYQENARLVAECTRLMIANP